MNWNDVQQLIAERAQEGLSLEFKRHEALSKANVVELVKDVTGFANAAGGSIVYGIAEAVVEGIHCAAELSPVTDAAITKEWITQVLRTNSSPPLSGFDVQEIAVPAESGDGRIVVIAIEASGTAHQSLKDHKYYLRTGANTQPMVDFQIRDVMNRRTKPAVIVRLVRQNLERTGDLHRYAFIARLTNVGLVSVEKWQLEIDFMTPCARPGLLVDPVIHRVHVADRHADDGLRVTQVTVGDPLWDGRSLILHPGRSIDLDQNLGIPQLSMHVTHHTWAELHGRQVPLKWRLYLPNAQPVSGELAFDEWCSF